jgi:hypothetical protein
MMNAHGAIKGKVMIPTVQMQSRSEHEVMRYYQSKLASMTYAEKYQLLNSLDEKSRYLLFSVMNYK